MRSNRVRESTKAPIISKKGKTHVNPALNKPKAPRKAKPPEFTPQQAELLDILAATYTHHPLGDLAGGDPFKVLVSCIISLRTKDEVTIPVSARLFETITTPQALVALDEADLAQRIYPCGFYKTKARNLQAMCQILIDQYDSQVPSTIDELLTLPGVGRKTANLVVGLGHGLPAICVDSHVHRIGNRMGWVSTSTPDETETALRALLPVRYWAVINHVLVLHGREVCRPIGAWCDVCPVAPLCPQLDVRKRKPPKPTL
jgi:endonuclease III